MSGCHWSLLTFLGARKEKITSKADAAIIGISANLPPTQIDTKLTALLTRSTSKRLAGTFTTLTGETEA